MEIYDEVTLSVEDTKPRVALLKKQRKIKQVWLFHFLFCFYTNRVQTEDPAHLMAGHPAY